MERRGALEDKSGGTITITVDTKLRFYWIEHNTISVINTSDLQNTEAIMNSVKEPKDHSRR